MIRDVWRFARLPRWLRTRLIERARVEAATVTADHERSVERAAQRARGDGPWGWVVVGGGGGGGVIEPQGGELRMTPKDDYAKAIIEEGRRLAVTPRGIVIALATALVESNLIMFANAKVPASLALPHERVGSDGYSVGLFQQQVRTGDGGRWWWGPTSACMDPYRSAQMFFEALKRLPYNSTARSPGWYAQAVQRSAYPDRYDQRMGEAQALYDRLAVEVPPKSDQTGGSPVAVDYGITDTVYGFNPTTPANATGNSNGPRPRTDYIVLHTQEGGNGDALGLARFCNANQVSYNIEVDDERTVLNVPVIEGPWAAAEANGIGLHICFAGSYAAWSPEKWLSTDTSDGLNEDAMLWRGAKAAAAACQQFGVPAVYAGDGGRSGWPVLPKGIVGHRDFGRRGGGHTDPGSGFPMAEFVRRVNTFINPTEEDDMGFTDEDRKKLDYLVEQLGPGRDDWGPDGDLGRNDKGQRRTLRAGLAALLRGGK